MTLHLFRAGMTALLFGVGEMPAAASLASYLIPAVVVTAFIATVAWSPRRERRWMAAPFVLSASVYAFIAIGRVFAVMKNPALGGWVSRYHYVPTLRLSVAIAMSLAAAGKALGRPRASAALVFALWLGGMAMLWTRGGWVIDQHQNMRVMTEAALARIQTAIDAAPGPGPAFIPNQAFQPNLATPYEIGGWAGLFSIFQPDEGGRQVFFVESQPEVRAKAGPGSPMAALLFPPA